MLTQTDSSTSSQPECFHRRQLPLPGGPCMPGGGPPGAPGGIPGGGGIPRPIPGGGPIPASPRTWIRQCRKRARERPAVEGLRILGKWAKHSPDPMQHLLEFEPGGGGAIPGGAPGGAPRPAIGGGAPRPTAAGAMTLAPGPPTPRAGPAKPVQKRAALLANWNRLINYFAVSNFRPVQFGWRSGN